MIIINIALGKAIAPRSPNVKLHHMQAYSLDKKLKQALKLSFLAGSFDIQARKMLEPTAGSHDDKNNVRIKINVVFIHPRMFDSHDNLRSALKPVVDAIADILIPGQPAGKADGDCRLVWEYGQRKDKPKYYGLEIRMEKI